jgi:hypothetical protein
LGKLNALCDAEFSVFSQWGEDGIIEWLISKSDDIPKTFIEFGVEDYRESNTRFLLQNRNWRGLVIDSSKEHVATIKRDQVSWRHDLTAASSFITRENIGNIIAKSGFSGDVGLLSIDIDGNDYWVWEEITDISPHLVVVEYNANFGDIQPLTIPYRPDFVRAVADASNLYYGASCKAFEELGKRKGYVLLGSNRVGTNLFFAREDRAAQLVQLVSDRSPRPCFVREARAPSGELMLLGGLSRTRLIRNMDVVNVMTGVVGPIYSFGELFSANWLAEFSPIEKKKD